MQRKVWLLVLSLVTGLGANAQGYYFGVKGGGTIGVQQWESFERDPLFALHGMAFIESADANSNFGLFAQAGYNPKGSAIQTRNAFGINGNVFQFPTQNFIFHNLSLSLGAKQRIGDTSGNLRPYYLFGIRIDYNLDTNLDEYQDLNEQFPIYPFDNDQVIRDFTYGAIVGGGVELPFTEFVGMLLEFSVNPDFSLQYEQPSGEVFVNNAIFTGNIRVQERRIRNLTFEVTLGFRFLRRIEYID